MSYITKRGFSVLLCSTMILSTFSINFAEEIVLADELVQSETKTLTSGEWIYPDWAEGGGIQFDSATGTITDAETSVVSVHIPDTINGVSVTSIGYKAFSVCRDLVSITVPSSVTVIGNSA